jgi:hypothetical protein
MTTSESRMRSGFRWCKTGKRRPVLALLAAVVLGTSGCVVADGLRLEAVPGGPDEETLTGVAGTGPGNVWAVGRAEPDLRHNRPLLLHWTGKGWHRSPSRWAGVWSLPRSPPSTWCHRRKPGLLATSRFLPDRWDMAGCTHRVLSAAPC